MRATRRLWTGDPEQALRLVDEEKPDLVLLDLMLPGADGIELMMDILAMADVPIIFLSAYGRDELIARAARCWTATRRVAGRTALPHCTCFGCAGPRPHGGPSVAARRSSIIKTARVALLHHL